MDVITNEQDVIIYSDHEVFISFGVQAFSLQI